MTYTPREKARKAVFVPIWIIIREYFPQLLLSTTSVKNLDIWMLMSLLKKVCFYHPFWNEETQERGNHEPLVSLRRPGSAEQVQFFSVFWSNGGKREATVKCESRSKEGKKKHRCPYAHKDRETTKNILRIVNS